MNTFFRFKQFVVHQDRTAMKVGTDGVLLGCLAMAPEGVAPCRILDIGTGTGLIAIMMAQRFVSAEVVGIDVDADAVGQATDNCAASPFADRLRVRLVDANDLEPGGEWDMVVSNPPYFAGDLQCPDGQRNMARHTVGLSHAALARIVAGQLRDGGRAAVILPAEAEKGMTSEAARNGLDLVRVTTIFSVSRKPAKRVVCQYVKGVSGGVSRDTLVLLDADGKNSAEYRALTEEFYL